jgi:hypothetical protein
MKTPNATKTAPKALTLRSMTIKREGDLLIQITPGTNHCGPADQIVTVKPDLFSVDAPKHYMPVKYTCSVKCAPKTDERGFLFDQAAVDKYLKALAASKPISLSCEKLAENLAELLMAKIAKHTPHCEVIHFVLTLSPAPHKASITVEYGE